MEIKTLVLGDLDTNCYLVWDIRSKEGIVIDPAASGDFISQKIIDNKINLVGIVLTHAHFDHTLGLLELKLNFDVPIYIHEKDVFLLKQAVSSAKHWLKKTVDPVPEPDLFLTEGDYVTFGDCKLKVITTPGHTPGSICLYADQQLSGLTDQPVLFSGDTLFRGAVGRTDLSYSSPSDLHKSLLKLAKLPGGTVVYPGHGDVTTIADEF